MTESGSAGERTGTGFLYKADFAMHEGVSLPRLLLISNRHVFQLNKPTLSSKERMTLVLNKKLPDGTPNHGETHSFYLERLDKELHCHPDANVDLACVDVSGIANSEAYIGCIREEFLESIDYEKVALGGTVLFVGYPNGFYDDFNNLPLVRSGTLASLPSMDFQGRGEIIIDAQVFGGSSGSPVFVDWDDKYRLLGVIRGTLEGRTPSGTNAVLGLGAVVKQRHVKELINHAGSQIIGNFISSRPG